VTLDEILEAAVAHATSGRPHEAAESFARAIELVPDWAVLHCNHGVALNEIGAIDDAAAALRRSIVLDPNLEHGHYNLGVVQLRQGLLHDALASFRTAVALDPGHAEAHINAGCVLWRLGELTEAQAACERGMAINADIPEGHVILGNVRKDLGDVEGAIAHYRRASELRPEDVVARANLIFSLHYLEGTTTSEVGGETIRFAEAAASCRNPRAAASCRTPLSIGYVSANLRTHPGGFFLGAVLGAHDRRSFKITCYVDSSEEDEHSRRIRKCVDEWHSIASLSDEALAARIREDGIDILVDMNRFSGSCRLRAFALQPAPVQVSWMGGPITTTGLTAIDYILSDAIHTPPGHETSFVEQVIRLDNAYAVYQPPPYAPDVAPLPAPRNGHITFGCFNYLAKIGPQVLRLWSAILDAVPGSRLLLQSKAFAHAAARERFNDPRITLHGGVSHRDLLALYGEIDIALDPFPYSGGITTCEALWMGVPVITMPGRHVSVRHSVSHLLNAGLPELIADGPADYVTRAVRLASDVEQLAAMRTTLRQRVGGSNLCDAPRFTRQLEDAYRFMWRNRCES